MKKNVAISVVTLLASLYFIYFYFAKEEMNAGSLGTLGDFIGGNINPVLTFVSTILLIETLTLQRKATKIAESESEDAKKTIRDQAELARIQIFESSFFNLINLCLEDYKNAVIENNGYVAHGAKAFNEIERRFSQRKNNGESPSEVLDDLEQTYGDIVFSSIKTFSTVFSFVNENAPAGTQEKYISLATKLTPTPIIYLICIAKNHADWRIIAPFDKASFFSKKGICDLLAGYS